MDYKSLTTQTVCAYSLVPEHSKCVKSLGDFLLQTTGTPANVAVASVTYVSQGKKHQVHIPKFLTSKTQLISKATNTPITGEMLNRFLVSRNIYGYDAYGISLVGDYYTYPKKEDFKRYLKKFIAGNTQLSQERVEERLDELAKSRLDFFYHSEQAFILFLLKQDEVWEEVFKEADSPQPIDTMSLNILSYYDPCRRCGDFLLRFSEDRLKERLKSFFKEREWDESLIERMHFFSSIAGIKPYNDPKLDGSRFTPLRPQGVESLPGEHAGDFIPLANVMPRVCCAATEWLQ